MTATLTDAQAAQLREAARIAENFELMPRKKYCPGPELDDYLDGQEAAADSIAASLRSRAQEGRG